MGITKTEGFEPALLQHVVVLKALAHPARLAILLHILQSKSCICTDLVKELKPCTVHYLQAFGRAKNCKPYSRKHRAKFLLLLY